MYIEFTGYGPLAAVPPCVGIIALGFLFENGARTAVLGGLSAFAVSGLVLLVLGRYLRRSGHHSIGAIPLWIWGGIYFLLGTGLAIYLGITVDPKDWR
jgi:hypothetical protein